MLLDTLPVPERLWSTTAAACPDGARASSSSNYRTSTSTTTRLRLPPTTWRGLPRLPTTARISAARIPWISASTAIVSWISSIQMNNSCLKLGWGATSLVDLAAAAVSPAVAVTAALTPSRPWCITTTGRLHQLLP